MPLFLFVEFSGFFCNTDPFPITREVFATLKRPLPSTDSPALLTASPPVRLLNVKSQQPSAHLPADLQKLLKALSVLSSGQTQASSPTVDRLPPPPVAHQTYNAELICGRQRASRNGIYRDRTNCSIFYFCEGDDLNSLRYHIFFCPPGLEFSMDTCTCDWPSGRSCQRTSETFCLTQSMVTTTTTTTTAASVPDFDVNALSSLGQLLGITGGATSSFDCTGKQSGLYRDTHDCTKFYFCTTNGAASDGPLLRYDFICPARYAFSMETCRCELDRERSCRRLSKTECLLL